MCRCVSCLSQKYLHVSVCRVWERDVYFVVSVGGMCVSVCIVSVTEISTCRCLSCMGERCLLCSLGGSYVCVGVYRVCHRDIYVSVFVVYGREMFTLFSE